MKTRILCAALLVLLCSCNKTIDTIIQNTISPPGAAAAPAFTTYSITKGQHYATENGYKALEAEGVKFIVRFDSSAIYQTTNHLNQYDINKLYGFSDNGADHHQYSARFGWRWSDGALRIFAYVYNDGKMTSKELGTVAIDAETVCSIKAAGERYIFTWGDAVETMPRSSTTPTAKGYLLYPYFGGDETAPHPITIWIKKL